MDLKELSAYLIGLLRSDPEVVAAFLMGVLITSMAVFWLRLRLFSGHDAVTELARKDAEIARRDTELVRKDAQIAVLEAKLAILEARIADIPPFPERFAAMEARLAELNTENQCLRRDKQAAEADAEDLRTKLAQALAEARHWAKWYKNIEDENTRLAESRSFQED